MGTKVLDWSRAQVALMRPGAGSRALAAIMADLAGTRDGATYLAERIWGVSQQLELGGEHPLVGRSAPDFRLADGRRLGELLRAGQGALLVFDPASSLPQHGQRWQPSIACAADTGDAASGLGAVLVRPDGIVAWTCGIGGDMPGLDSALASWTGPTR